jgi:hypothetical protein
MLCWAFAEPSDGLEPSTPSLPWNLGGNRWQRTATVFARLSRFRPWPICHRLPPVATAALHKGSILRCLFWLRTSPQRHGASRGGSRRRAAPATTQRSAAQSSSHPSSANVSKCPPWWSSSGNTDSKSTPVQSSTRMPLAWRTIPWPGTTTRVAPAMDRLPALVFPQGSLGYAGAGSPGRAISSVSAMVSLRPASVARMTSSAASEARARSMSSRPTGLSP